MNRRVIFAKTAFSFWLATVTFASLATATPPAPAHPHVEAPRPSPRPTAGLAPKAVATPPKAAAAPPKVAIPIASARDWVKAPAIVEHTAPGDILAVSDLHGHYEEAFHLFQGNGVLRGKPSDPAHVEWTGGNATLVVDGDSINKGDGSIKIIDMLRQLQKEAPKFGGKVIVSLGNHEAEFLHEPFSERSLRDGSDGRTGFGHELLLHGERPDAVAAGTDAAGRGQWLRDLPFAAKVGDYFFVHSGSTGGLDLPSLGRAIQRAVTKGGFGHPYIVGEAQGTVLGADDWKATVEEAEKSAARLGAKYIVMGHIPDALDARGDIARTKDRTLIKLDTGLGNDVGEARMLRIRPDGRLKQLDASGDGSRLVKHKPD